jgi:hypothetical protein
LYLYNTYATLKREVSVSTKDRFTVTGKDLVEKVKHLIQQKETRKVCLIQEEKSLLEIPLTVGDVTAPAAVLAAPVLAALTAFATLVTECTIEVEKVDDTGKNKR